MARASTYTLLSLDRFSEIIGIAGPHFASADAGSFFPATDNCPNIWYQWGWQDNSNRVAREDLARTIADVENELAELVGFWPAPKFIAQEVHRYPKYYRPEQTSKSGTNSLHRGFPTFTYNSATGADNRPKGIKLEWGKFIQAGQRGLTSVGTATTAGGTLTYTDADGDGFSETVTITLPTTLTEACEIKAYVPGETDPEWEIRPARSVTISGGNVVMTFWVWQFIDPDLWEVFPSTSGIGLINITSPPTNMLTSVDVYREYVDETSTSAQFYWEPDVVCSCCGGSGCADCELTSQTGCIHPRSVETGFVVPKAATYDEDTEQWDPTNFTQCVEPDIVKVWYRAGDYSNRWLRGIACNPMDTFWETTIAYMAVARLDGPACSCDNLEYLGNRLKTDLAMSETGKSRFVTQDTQTSPFGTLRGEVMAWRRIKGMIKKVMRTAVVN